MSNQVGNVNGFDCDASNDLSNGVGECHICSSDVHDICFVGDYNGRYYPAHKSLLVRASGYFREYFMRHAPNEPTLEPIYITDVEPVALVQCLDFIYTGHLSITSKNLKNFAEAALVLKMDAVWDYCVAYGVTHVSTDTFFDLRMMAASTCSQKLLDATGMFALCNFELLMGHEEFALIDKTLLLFLLGHKKIKMIPERKVYEAVIAWINFIPSKRKHHLPELLRFVNLEQIPIDYLKDVVHGELLVMEDTECRNLVEEALFCHLHPGLSAEDGSSVLAQHCLVILDDELRAARTFNPWSGRWKEWHGATAYDRSFVTAAVGRRVFVFGADRRTFCLDTATGAWSEMAEMSGAERSEPSAASVEGLVYVTGGVAAATGKGVRAAERFDPASNSWEKVQSMKKPRSKHCLATSRGFVYAIGGANNNGAPLRLVERLSPKQGVWMNVAPMKKARSGAFCAVKQESIFVFGGAPDSDSVEMLNSSGSGWTMLTAALPKGVLCACAVEDDIFVVCSSPSEGDLEIQEVRVGGEQPTLVEKVKGRFGSMAVVKI